MNDKTITAECSSCESSYQVSYIDEFVSQEYPENCPFCGDPIEEITEEYIDDEDSEDDDEWD
jgi:hypothetical protein